MKGQADVSAAVRELTFCLRLGTDSHNSYYGTMIHAGPGGFCSSGAAPGTGRFAAFRGRGTILARRLCQASARASFD